MSRYASHVSTAATPQNDEVLGKNQVQNSAGGFVFQVDDWQRLDRFLILGCEGGTYYAAEKSLTKNNAAAVLRCIAQDGVRVVNRIIEISDSGRAVKNEPAIFALALVVGQGSVEAKALALANLSKVCRIGTHLFQFMSCIKQLGKWGRSLRRAVSRWYTDQEPAALGMQVVKYQNRAGYTHRDVLRLAHPKAAGEIGSVLKYAAGKGADGASKIIAAHEEARTADEKRLVSLIREYGLVRESIPTEFLKSPKIWDALLNRMPMTAMVRNLGNMSKCGLLVPLSEASSVVENRLRDVDALRNSRLHPMSILIAIKTYAQGRGVLGSGQWIVVPSVVDALNEAFYASFANVESVGRRFLLGVDVSGSMGNPVSSTPVLKCSEAAAALAMTIARTEPASYIHGFCHEFVDLGISGKTRLDDACRRVQRGTFGGTDCALPMIYAMRSGVRPDVFVVITDNETWFGNIHPFQALRRYRDETGINAKLVVIGMRATEFSIADPSDRGMLDVVGFDAALPQTISHFVRE